MGFIMGIIIGLILFILIGGVTFYLVSNSRYWIPVPIVVLIAAALAVAVALPVGSGIASKVKTGEFFDETKVGEIDRVSYNPANFREGPGIHSNEIGQLPRGSKVRETGKRYEYLGDAPYPLWIEVQVLDTDGDSNLIGVTGWMAAQAID